MPSATGDDTRPENTARAQAADGDTPSAPAADGDAPSARAAAPGAEPLTPAAPAEAAYSARYGRRSGAEEAAADRRLKIVGGVLGAVFVAFLVWVGVFQVTSQPVTGELTGFTVLSEDEVEATIQVRKPAGTTGVCTVRSQAEDGLEVGRAEFRFEDEADTVHRAVTLRTTGLATSAELLSCGEAAG